MNSDNNTEKLGNGRSIEKQIAVVFAKTLSIILVLMFAAVFYLSLFAPSVMASATSSVGMKNASFYYSKVQYARDDNINSLYTVVNKAIELNKSRDVEKYCEKLFARENYYDFITYIENENIISVGTSDNTNADKINLMISLANEDMYLKNKYIGALLANGKTSKAYEVAYADLLSVDKPLVLTSRVHWCYSNLATLNGPALTTEQQTTVQEYVENAFNLYSSTNYNSLDSNGKFNYAVLENSLKRILNDIKRFKSHGATFSGLTDENIETMITTLNGGNI